MWSRSNVVSARLFFFVLEPRIPAAAAASTCTTTPCATITPTTTTTTPTPTPTTHLGRKALVRAARQRPARRTSCILRDASAARAHLTSTPPADTAAANSCCLHARRTVETSATAACTFPPLLPSNRAPHPRPQPRRGCCTFHPPPQPNRVTPRKLPPPCTSKQCHTLATLPKPLHCHPPPTHTTECLQQHACGSALRRPRRPNRPCARCACEDCGGSADTRNMPVRSAAASCGLEREGGGTSSGEAARV